MAGLTVVAEMIGMIGASARAAAAEIEKATEAAKTYEATTSSMSKAAGSGTSDMGSSSNAAPGTAALAAALQMARGRMK